MIHTKKKTVGIWQIRNPQMGIGGQLKGNRDWVRDEEGDPRLFVSYQDAYAWLMTVELRGVLEARFFDGDNARLIEDPEDA